ncbi:Polymerase/histidinol phosphatase-like protein [Chytriomyces sp. MP71]|nr:Polymerase/histidinol phosphatase-like protein [Chytriomyces sp. MP71]
MPISLHSHSGQYCKHAKGTLREVVETAVRLGFVAYGLSEHMPRTRDQDLYPEEVELGMAPADTSSQYLSFLAEARSLQSEYADRISLLVGMETEYILSASLADAKVLAAQYNLDYLVGSLHHVHEVPIDFSEELYAKAEAQALHLRDTLTLGNDVVCSTEHLFRNYYDAQLEMLLALKPLVVGHFDLISMFRPRFLLSEEVWQRIERNVVAIAAYGGIVEINSRAWKKGLEFAYPSWAIVEKMKEKGVRFCLSDDSHGPKDVGMHYAKLKEYLALVNVNTVYYPVKVDDKIEVRSIGSLDEHPFWKMLEHE